MQEIITRLIEKKILQQHQVEKAKIVAAQRSEDVLKTIMEAEPGKEKSILSEMSLVYKIPYLDLEHIYPGKDVIYMMSEDFARKNSILPLFKISDWFFIGMTFPVDQYLVTEVRNFTGLNVKPCLIANSQIQAGIDKVYRAISSAEKIVQKIGEIGEDIGGSVIQIIDLLVAQAVRDRTSDIHIEPEVDKLRIRFRIDGVLQEVPSPPKSLETAMISRIKVMADLNIAESRLPQDGHFKLNVDAKDIDVRVSTLPTVNGENVVLRILDTGPGYYHDRRDKGYRSGKYCGSVCAYRSFSILYASYQRCAFCGHKVAQHGGGVVSYFSQSGSCYSPEIGQENMPPV